METVPERVFNREGEEVIQNREMFKMFNQSMLNELRRQAAAIPVLGSRTLSSDQSTASNLEANPYYSKYEQKLKEAQQKANASAATFSEPVSPEQEAIKEGLKRFELKYEADSRDPGPRSGGGKRKTLDGIVKMDLLKELPAEEVSRVWSGYHSKKKDCIYAILKSEEYDMITSLAKEYPVFLYPIPRDDTSVANKQSMGYQFFIGQFQNDSCYFTPLVYYQRYKDLAPISLAVNYYPELKTGKGIVLMNGEYDQNVINLLEVQCLANQFKLYYENPSEKKRSLLHAFNKNPGSFNHLDVVTEFEVSVAGGR